MTKVEFTLLDPANLKVK